jgi:hypothetical protein
MQAPAVRQPQVPSERQHVGSGAHAGQRRCMGQRVGPPSTAAPEDDPELAPPSARGPPESPPELAPGAPQVPPPLQACPMVVQSSHGPPERPHVMSWLPAWQTLAVSQQPVQVPPPSPQVPVPVPLLLPPPLEPELPHAAATAPTRRALKHQPNRIVV